MRIQLGIMILVSILTLTSVASEKKQNNDLLKVAQVNDVPITWGEVRRDVELALNGRKTSSQLYQHLCKKMLETYVDRVAVQIELQKGDHAINPAAVDRAIKRLEKQIAQRKEKLPDYLRRTGQSEQQLRRRLLWQAVWKNYLAAKTKADALKKFYQAHHRDYDGTEIQVRQILWKKDDKVSAKSQLQQANLVREEILTGKISFAQAVKKYSQAASKENGGDLGMISRHGQNVETFSQAAFTLQQDEISPAVQTTFGIHLIQCTKIKPGTVKWNTLQQKPKIYRQVKEDWAKLLFKNLATKARAKVKVKYLQKLPGKEDE